MGLWVGTGVNTRLYYIPSYETVGPPTANVHRFWERVKILHVLVSWENEQTILVVVSIPLTRGQQENHHFSKHLQ